MYQKNANIAKVEFNRALHLYPIKESNWQPKVLTASALQNLGIQKIDTMITDYISLTKENKYFDIKRNEQNKYWLLSTINQQLKDRFYQNSKVKNALTQEIKDLENGKTTPFNAAKRLLEL